jgi:hypothetical protein
LSAPPAPAPLPASHPPVCVLPQRPQGAGGGGGVILGCVSSSSTHCGPHKHNRGGEITPASRRHSPVTKPARRRARGWSRSDRARRRRRCRRLLARRARDALGTATQCTRRNDSPPPPTPPPTPSPPRGEGERSRSGNIWRSSARCRSSFITASHSSFSTPAWARTGAPVKGSTSPPAPPPPPPPTPPRPPHASASLRRGYAPAIPPNA